MKKIISFFFFLFLISASLVSIHFKYDYFCDAYNLRVLSEKQEDTLSPDDWKIVLDDDIKKENREFDFIQKNLASSDLADNGHLLMFIGIFLIAISVFGTIFFSFCLYKLCKNTKRFKNKYGTRYKK